MAQTYLNSVGSLSRCVYLLFCEKQTRREIHLKRIQFTERPTADELEEFLSEIATMKKVGRHPNVVTLLGCCTIKQPLCMIMEYVGCGDLLHYLRQLRAQHEARSTAVSGIVRPAGQMDANLFSIQHSNSEHFGKYLELFHSS